MIGRLLVAAGALLTAGSAAGAARVTTSHYGTMKDGREVEFRAPITIDCSGKESFAAVSNNWRLKDPQLNKVAVWTYYKGAKL